MHSLSREGKGAARQIVALAAMTGICWLLGSRPALAGPPPGPSTDNLLVNGSFEEPDLSTDPNGGIPVGPGDLPGWQIVKGPADLLDQRVWQPGPGQGDQDLHLASSQGAAVIAQSFATDPGDLYTFSGWLSRSPDIDAALVSVSLNGELLATLLHNSALYGATSRADMRWQPFALSFTAAAATTTLQLADSSGRGSVGAAVLDGLAVRLAGGQISSAPEPSSMSLLGLGAVAGLFRRRRR